MSRVDIVIPTYNGRDYLRRCLYGIDNQTFRNLKVIVVDDASTDGTDQMMANDFSDFTYIRLSRNVGFAAACNAGIGAGSAPFVALLNNDTVPDPDWLEHLISAATRHTDAGAFASKIVLADGSGRLHSAGDTFSWSGLPNSRGVWEYDEGQYDSDDEVFSACAAAALYRRSALDAVSSISRTVFDTDFFMYCEDIDLAWRLRLLGYSVVYVPRARVFHHLSATGGGPLASYYVARNCFAVLAKNLPTKLQRWVWPRFLFHQARQLMAALRHIREPAARARVRGILAGPRFARRQRAKRRALQSSARADAASITRMLSR